MTVTVTEADITSGTIGEEVRRLVADLIAPIADRHVTAGLPAEDVAHGVTFGLIAVACTFASTSHASSCPCVRRRLHVAVDCLLDQLIAFDAGRINQDGETVQ